MKSLLSLAFFLLAIASYAASPALAETPAPAATPAHAATPASPAGTPAMELVRTFYNTLTETMKQGDKLGFEGRYKMLEPAVTKVFNLPLMARHAVGLGWSKETAEDQQKLVDAFTRFSIATYASRFTKYDGEKFDVIDEKPVASGGVMVETKLTPNGGDPVTLNYLVRNDETGTPRIMDVYLDAAISELATRRAEFNAVIKREGFHALVGSLAEKAKQMGLVKAG